MIIKRKIFSKYDSTDILKGMKDSDILAEKKRTQPIGQNLMNGAASAGTGALAGAGIGGVLGMATGKGARLAKGGRLAVAGAAIGGLIGAGKAAVKANNQANENAWYNDRLKYAQKNAKRREKKDWKTNMTQRDGYSY